MSFYVKPEIKYLLENPDKVPITPDRYFKLTKAQAEYLEKLIRRIDSIPSEKVETMTHNEKLRLSSYINNAERFLQHGKVI